MPPNDSPAPDASTRKNASGTELKDKELKQLKELKNGDGKGTALALEPAVAEVTETASLEAPSAEISWRIVCYMYAVGFAISLGLGAVQVRMCHSNMGPIDQQIG